MACDNCFYWQPHESGTIGECRRYAPKPADHQSAACWPITDNTEWCGEFKEDTEGTEQ